MDVVVTGASGLIGTRVASRPRRRRTSACRARATTGCRGRRDLVGPGDGPPRPCVDRGRRRRDPPRWRRHRRQALDRTSRSACCARAGCKALGCSPVRLPALRDPPPVLVSWRRRSATTATAATRSSPRRAPRARVSHRPLQGVGVGDGTRRASGHASSLHIRSGIVLTPKGGALGEAAAALPASARWSFRLGSPVAELDLDRRRDGSPILHLLTATVVGAGEPHRAEPGAQPRARDDPGPRAAPSGHPARTEVRSLAARRQRARREPALTSASGFVPDRLEESGFVFAHPSLEGALGSMLDSRD